MKPIVLVLDDEIDVTSVLAKALETEGYAVRETNSAATFELARKEIDPDIYLVDVHLPDGNGMKIAKDLRGQTDAGIILVTGKAESIDRILGLELGADDYITKPFNIRELRARVNAVFRRTAPIRNMNAQGSSLRGDARETKHRRFHGITLDLEARRVVSPKGEELVLTTLEFNVTAMLAGHVNKVLSRDQIMDGVRGPGWAAYDRAIDGIIARLRKKLFPDGSGDRKIKTVRGVGYMLAVPAPEAL